MNKLFTKIAGAVIGLTMAVGVGVGIASNDKSAGEVKAASAQWELVTAAPSDWSGEYILGNGTSGTIKIMDGSSFSSSSCAGVDATVTSSKITADTADALTIAKSSTTGKYTVILNGKYIGKNANSNGIDANATWSSSLDNDITYSGGKVVIKGNGGRVLTWYASNSNFRYYAATNNNSQLYKKVEAQTYTVSFGVNTAGYGTVSPTSIDNVPSGSSITVSGNQVTINGTTVTATPTANSAQYTYAFTGWSNTSGTVDAARTITANFSRTTNTFTVNDDNVTGGHLDSTASIEYGGKLDVNVVPDTGYTYPLSVTVTMGGNDISSEVQYEDGYIYYTPVTGNIVVTAACEPEGTAYTVTYNPNGGSVTPTSEQIIENGHPSFPTPTRSGYNFKGWQVNGSGTAYTDPEDYTVIGDVTFVASWAAVYTVTFDSNGGSESPAAKSIETGSTFTFPSAGTKTHYSFDGWTSTGSEPYYAAGATSPAVTGNITYTAHWTEDAKYTVTYSAGTNCTGSYAHTNNYGGTYTLLAVNQLSGITYDDSTYRFKDYTVGGVSKQPGQTFTLSAATTVTVNFELKPIETTYNFVTNFSTYASGWSGYASKTLDGKTNLAGDYAATVTLPYASKQTGTITTMPVVADQATGDVIHISFALTESKYELEDVTVTLVQWGTKTPTMKLFKGTEASGEALDTGVMGTKNTLSASNIGGTTFVVAMNDNGTTRNQVGVQSIAVTLKALSVLDSVTSSGEKATFSAGEKFSYGGTLTAHYTQGKADATVTPDSFKIGNSGIDPTSAGTGITTNTTMTIAAHNGKYIYVIYEEDEITKWASYQITVNPAAPTGVALSSYSATVGIDETFTFSDINVTINPSEYATQDAYEWIMVDDLGLNVEFDYPDIVVHEDSNGEPLIIRCRSTVNNNVYADFELFVSGNPMAVLYDENNDDVTSGSANYFADYGNDIYYHVVATNFGNNVSYTWNSSNPDILSVDDKDGASCGYYIEDGASGTARLSCTVSGSKGTLTVYVDVTITAVTVTSVTWAAPTVDVYSGTTLSSTSGWNVKYNTNSGKTDQTPDSFNVKLGGSTISLPHTWVAADDGKTLGVEVGGVLSSTVTVKVTQTINSVVAQIPGTPISEYQLVESQSDLEEGRYLIVSIQDNKAFDGSLGTLDAGQNNFDVTITDGTVIANDSTASGKYFDLTVENDAWTITSASGENVGHSASGNGMNGTGTNTITISEGVATILGTGGKGLAYNSASGSTSERFRYYTSPAANANHSVSLFKLVEEPGTPTSTEIANVTAHKEAQRVAVKFAMAFNAAMDETENCTTGLDDAWEACESAYNTFKKEAAALGSEKDYAEYYIKYATKKYSDDSGEACIERMMKTYEVMVQKHGKTPFMSDLLSSGATTGRINPLISITNGGNNSVTAILVISLTSLVAIAGYFYFRKREEK